MLMCNETVTVVRGTGQGYTVQTYEGASWYDKTIVSVQNNGLAYANMVKVRLPEAVLEGAQMLPEVGDHIVRGAVESVPETPAELAAYSPRKIIRVGDNRRGKFPHLEVEGK